MGRGKWSGSAQCPVCGRTISTRGFAWKKHEDTHPEYAAEKRRRKREAKKIFDTALRIAGIKESK